MTTQKNDPAGFEQGLDKASQENYLGSPDTIDSMLRLFAVEIGEKSREGKEVWVKWITEKMQAITSTMLGQDPDYVGIEGWNQPGGIDKEIRSFYAERGDSPQEKAIAKAKTPELTIELVLREFVEDMQRMRKELSKPNTNQETMRLSLEGIFEFYTKLLMGLPISQTEESPEEAPASQPETQ